VDNAHTYISGKSFLIVAEFAKTAKIGQKRQFYINVHTVAPHMTSVSAEH